MKIEFVPFDIDKASPYGQNAAWMGIGPAPTVIGYFQIKANRLSAPFSDDLFRPHVLLVVSGEGVMFDAEEAEGLSLEGAKTAGVEIKAGDVVSFLPNNHMYAFWALDSDLLIIDFHVH